MVRKHLFGPLFFVLFLFFFVFGVIQTPAIKNQIIKTLIEKIVDEPHHTVYIEGPITGFFPFKNEIPLLKISDKKTEWITLKHISWKLDLFSLSFSFLRLGEIDIIRPPILESETPPPYQSLLKIFTHFKELSLQQCHFKNKEKDYFIKANILPAAKKGRDLSVHLFSEGKKIESLNAYVFVNKNNIDVEASFKSNQEGLLATLLNDKISLPKGNLKGTGSIKINNPNSIVFGNKDIFFSKLFINHSETGTIKLFLDKENNNFYFNSIINTENKKNFYITTKITTPPSKANVFEIKNFILQNDNKNIMAQSDGEFSLQEAYKFKGSINIFPSLWGDNTKTTPLKIKTEATKIKNKFKWIGSIENSLQSLMFLGKKINWSINGTTKTENLKIEKFNIKSDKEYTLQGDGELIKKTIEGNIKTHYKKELLSITRIFGALNNFFIKTNFPTQPPFVPFFIENILLKANLTPLTNNLSLLAKSRNNQIKAFYENEKINGEIFIKDFVPSFQNLGTAKGRVEINKKGEGRARLILYGSKIGNSELNKIEIKTKSEKNNISITLDSFINNKNLNFLSAKGIVDLKNKILNINYIKSDIEKVIVKKPIIFDISKMEVNPFSILVEKGEITSSSIFIQGSKNKEWRGSLSLKNIPLSILRFYSPPFQGKGSINTSLNISGKEKSPNLKGKLEISNVSIKKESIPFSISSSIEKEAERIGWNTKLKTEKNALIAQGKINLLNNNIDCYLKGNINLNTIKPLLPKENNIGGKAFFDVTINKTLKNPIIIGTIQIKEGLYENEKAGVYIKNIHFLSKTNQNNKFNFFIKAKDYKKNAGDLEGKGIITINSFFYPPLILGEISLKKFEAVHSDAITALTNGTIKIKGNASGLNINGTVKLSNFKILLRELIEKEVPSLEEKLLISKTTSFPKKKKTQETYKKDINLTLDMTDPFSVQGFGIKSSWEGKIKAIGSLFSPSLEGTINLKKGVIELLGKKLSPEKGNISFHPDNGLDPVLFILLKKQVLGYLLTVIAEGKASSPDLSFSSIPPKTTEEILFLLLFEKETKNMSVTESLQLASLVTSLNTKKGLGFIEDFKSSFGFDSLEFKENASKDNKTNRSISLGKEFGKAKISIEQGVTGQNESKANLVVSLTKNLSFEGSVGGIGSSAGLKLSKVY